MDQLSDSVPTDPTRLAIPRPIDDKGLALDLGEVDESPKARIEAMVAVVSHDEVGIFRNGDRAEVIPIRHGVRRTVVLVDGVRFVLFPAVQVKFFILHLDGVSRKPHDPFDEIFRLIFREAEDDDVASMRLPDRNQCHVGKGETDSIDEFVHQDMIADVQRRNHRARRNLKRLHDERPDHQCQNDGDDQGFGVLPNRRFQLVLFRQG